MVQLSLLRGDGGFGDGGSTDPLPTPHAMPDGAPDDVCELATPAQLALIYRLSGDLNPLHADPAVASAAGFAPDPARHGADGRGRACGAAHGARLRQHAFRGHARAFTAPAWPGDTLRTEMWVRGNTVSLRVTAVERNVVVLTNARVDLR